MTTIRGNVFRYRVLREEHRGLLGGMRFLRVILPAFAARDGALRRHHEFESRGRRGMWLEPSYIPEERRGVSLSEGAWT